MIQPATIPGASKRKPVETWGDILAAQAGDLVPLAAFLLLAYVSFHRKSVRAEVRHARRVGRLHGVLQEPPHLDHRHLPRASTGASRPSTHNLAWYLFAGFTVVSTVLWGRFYCGRVCAFGALTQLMDAALPQRWRVEVPEGARSAGPAGSSSASSAGVLAYYVVTHNTMVYRYVEPFWMFGRSETSPLLWVGLGVLLVATVFVRNLYCRFLCPLGATLGLVSLATVFQHQALVGVHDLHDLREDLRVGRDRRPEDPGHRVRALRRLRAALRRHGRSARTGGSWTTGRVRGDDPAYARQGLGIRDRG